VPVSPQAELIALLVVTSLVSLFTIVFGELVPHGRLALARQRLALLFAVPIDFVGRLLGRSCGC
jgi:CBS domain containing-hemolysin-like protein